MEPDFALRAARGHGQTRAVADWLELMTVREQGHAQTESYLALTMAEVGYSSELTRAVAHCSLELKSAKASEHGQTKDCLELMTEQVEHSRGQTMVPPAHCREQTEAACCEPIATQACSRALKHERQEQRR
jgi:biotin synthase-related radical SAM superfamily protein